MGWTQITPVDITPGSGAGAWTDVDVTAYVPAGTKVVGLRLVNTSASAAAMGVRPNGSSDNRTTGLQATDHQGCIIGLDGSLIFEVNFASMTAQDVYLIGYGDSDFVAFTNAPDKSAAGTGVEDIDVSGDTGGDTAVGIGLEFIGGTSSNWMVRKNGSTDNRSQDNVQQHCFVAIGVDGSELAEQQVGATTIDCFLNWYVTARATFNTNATDVSTGTTGSYVDMTALAAGAVAAWYESFSASGTTAKAYRDKDDSAWDIYPASQSGKHAFYIIGLDSARVGQQKISGTGGDTYEIGYYTAPVAGTTMRPPPTVVTQAVTRAAA